MTAPIADLEKEVDVHVRRPYDQWWLPLRTVTETVSFPNADVPVLQIPIEDAEPLSAATLETMIQAEETTKKGATHHG